jgi:aminopeptidase N
VQHFSSVPGMLEAFTRFYGPYPFDKVGYCATPIGSMEHQTMISYAASQITSQPAGRNAAHELSHQWWGDCVTMKTFADTWLSEGFATFSEAVYAEHLGGRVEYERAAVKFGSTYINSVAPSEGVFPLYDYPRADPSSNYPWSIYYKGGAVLVMLRQVMGDTAFFHGMRAHFEAHKYGNTSTLEFRAAMEAAHGSTLDWFFDQWVMKKGWPSYLVQRIVDTSAAPFRIRILQTQDSTTQPFFRMPLDVRIIRNNGDTTNVTIENRARSSEDIAFPGVPSNTVKRFTVDPKGFVLKYLNYGTTAVGKLPLPASQSFSLEPAFPNPMRAGDMGTVTVTIGSAQPRRLRLSVFDSLGREARVLAEREWPSGRHGIPFSAAGLPVGNYTLQLRSESGAAVQRLVIGR